MNFSGSQRRSIHPAGSQNNTTNPYQLAVDSQIFLSQRRGHDVDPTSEWSKYSKRDSAHAGANPVHSQGPSHFSSQQGYGAHSGEYNIHCSRLDNTPSPAPPDSRGSMLASQGILAAGRTGSNTGAASTIHATQLNSHIDATIRLASQECVTPSRPPIPGPVPDPSFLAKQTGMLLTFPRFSRIQVLSGQVPEDKLDTIQDVVHPEDWSKFVLGELLFKEMRFHKNFMLLPKFASERLTFDDDTLLTTNVDPT